MFYFFTTYHLSGTGNRVVNGTDQSVTIVNETQLFDKLTSTVTAAVADEAERKILLNKLEDLQKEKNKPDYLTKVTKFIAAAGSIAHLLSPYLPALVEKAESLL
jgi:hypothetical protein